MTKIDIISGFLGAGKTTLIKKLIKEALQGEKLVLIENEFGEIGIDGGFLKDSGIQVTEMNSGCICCSLVGDFGTALEEVLNTYNPDRIIIEPSGVGKLSDVIQAVKDITDRNDVRLNSYTAVTDAKKCKMYMKNFGEFFNNQIIHAKTIILSRTDDISEEKLDQCIKIMRDLNSEAVMITTPWNDLDGRAILNEMEKHTTLEKKVFDDEVCDVCGHVHAHSTGEHKHDGHSHEDNREEHGNLDHSHEDNQEEHEHCGHSHEDNQEEHKHCGHSHEDNQEEHEHCGHSDIDHNEGCSCGHDHKHGHHHEHGHHHADEIFMSWGIETHHKYMKEDLTNILETLTESDEYGMILRAKGMLSDKEGKWMYFDLVPGEYEIRDGMPQVTGRICVIGSNIKEEKLSELFAN